MAREARTFAEGSLRWVQASGTGAWTTASAAPTALMGFVQAGANFNSGRGVVTVMERGSAHHHKVTTVEPVEISFTYLQAVTGNIPNPLTASGASVPAAHFELRSTDAEALSGPSAQWFQFHQGVMLSRGWTEGAEGNQLQETWRFLSMTGPTGSGYFA